MKSDRHADSLLDTLEGIPQNALFYAATMVIWDGNERAGAGRRKGAAPGVSEPRMELFAAPVADGIVAGRPCTVRNPMTAMV
jgi:hypothetical protein